MNREEIIRMAREAGWKDLRDFDSEMREEFYMADFSSLERFAALVAAAERLAQPEQKWVGLTEAEKVNVALACGCADVAWMDFADAIEAKLKEKNT